MLRSVRCIVKMNISIAMSQEVYHNNISYVYMKYMYQYTIGMLFARGPANETTTSMVIYMFP